MKTSALPDLLGAMTVSGFGIVEGLFSLSDISLIEQAISRSPMPRTKAGIRHALREPAIANLARDPRLLSLASEFVGLAAFAYRATLFEKSSDANWLVVWHQDTALPLHEHRELQGWGPWSVKDGIDYAHAPARALEQVIAIRVHLDDSNADNGPLRVLPGTHRLGVLTDDTIHQLSEEIESQECLVERGGVVLMRPLLVHASSKSRSNVSRRVVHIEYAAQRVLDGMTLRET